MFNEQSLGIQRTRYKVQVSTMHIKDSRENWDTDTSGTLTEKRRTDKPLS